MKLIYRFEYIILLGTCVIAEVVGIRMRWGMEKDICGHHVLDFWNHYSIVCCRCMLRGFRLHRCPYWIRPSITVSDHNGYITLSLSLLCLWTPSFFFFPNSKVYLNRCLLSAGLLFSTKKHPRTKDLSVCYPSPISDFQWINNSLKF